MQGKNYVGTPSLLWEVKIELPYFHIAREHIILNDCGPMLVQCRASVADADPTLNQHWMNTTCWVYIHKMTSRQGSMSVPSSRLPWEQTSSTSGEKLSASLTDSSVCYSCWLFGGRGCFNRSVEKDIVVWNRHFTIPVSGKVYLV